jgi:hypothetical protein
LILIIVFLLYRWVGAGDIDGTGENVRKAALRELSPLIRYSLMGKKVFSDLVMRSGAVDSYECYQLSEYFNGYERVWMLEWQMKHFHSYTVHCVQN